MGGWSDPESAGGRRRCRAPDRQTRERSRARTGESWALLMIRPERIGGVWPAASRAAEVRRRGTDPTGWTGPLAGPPPVIVRGFSGVGQPGDQRFVDLVGAAHYGLDRGIGTRRGRMETRSRLIMGRAILRRGRGGGEG
jgi:hypothetical protein